MVNNKIEIAGVIETGFMWDHDSGDECFYQFLLRIRRKNRDSDIIPVIISDKLIDVSTDMTGRSIFIDGELRSFIHRDRNGSIRLFLYAFPQKASFLKRPADINLIFLQGTVCQKPEYRRTPQGRWSTDVMLAVERGAALCDYIPCSGQNHQAGYLSVLPVGSRIRTIGSIQSRRYHENGRMNTGFELSLTSVESVV